MSAEERVKFITHMGVRIFITDASGLRDRDEIMAVIQRSEELAEQEPEKSILALTVVTDTHFDDDVLKATKRATKHNAAYFKASATVGVSGLKKALLPLIAVAAGRTIKNFNTQEEALAWLVKQSKA